MEINSVRPAAESVSPSAIDGIQAARFKERRQREAQSDVRNEAVYFSPVIKIDKETQSAVIQYRDSETGEVKNQYPDNQKVVAYQHAEETSPPPEQKAPAVKAEVEKAPVKAEAPKDEQKVDEEA